MVSPGGAVVWNLLHVALLVPRISKWLLDFWRIVAPRIYVNCNILLKTWTFLRSYESPDEVADGLNVVHVNTYLKKRLLKVILKCHAAICVVINVQKNLLLCLIKRNALKISGGVKA
jgi:hypothetical protein